ncbi:hypothetical protein U1Q18_017767, partial [Sarracenia purpurea var. burkii]
REEEAQEEIQVEEMNRRLNILSQREIEGVSNTVVALEPRSKCPTIHAFGKNLLLAEQTWYAAQAVESDSTGLELEAPKEEIAVGREKEREIAKVHTGLEDDQATLFVEGLME